MKKIFLVIAVLCLALSGCSEDAVSGMPMTMEATASKIIVRALDVEAVTGDTRPNDVMGQIVFTGDDILWFNETTKELRFKDNMLYTTSNHLLFKTQAIGFYLDGEFLFSSMVYVDNSSPQVFDSLVLCYYTTENKYYLLDGYPPDSQTEDLLSENSTSPQGGRQNIDGIAPEWSKFVNQLKEEDKYKD